MSSKKINAVHVLFEDGSTQTIFGTGTITHIKSQIKTDIGPNTPTERYEVLIQPREVSSD